MSTTPAEIISSLAILKTQNSDGQDYLQNFVPFMAECLRISKHETVSLSSLQADFKSVFGLDIPQGVLKTLLSKGLKQKLIINTGNVYYRNTDKLAELNITTEKAKAVRELDALISKFIEYCKEKFERKIDIAKAELILYEFIREYGSEVLKANEGWHENQSSDNFLAGSFVTHLYSSDPEGFTYLEQAVKGSMITAMLHYHNPSQITQAWGPVKIFFDGPLLLNALGIYGDTMQAPYLELMKILKQQGLSLCCFQRTVDELQRVLAAIERNLRLGSTRPLRTFEELGERLLSASYSPADIVILSASLPKKLLEIGISVVQEPGYQVHLTVDTPKAEAAFGSYLNPLALEHDVEAMFAIHRLRHGRAPREIEICDALFVTTNVRVVRAAKQVSIEQLNYGSSNVPLCMTYDGLTTLVWLKNPSILHDLPRKQLIADALAALKPSKEVWNRYLTEIESLRSQGKVDEDQIIYLRCAPEATDELTKITINDSEAYVEGTVEQILHRSKAAMSREAEDKFLEEQTKKLDAQQQAQEQDSHLLKIAHNTSNGVGLVFYYLLLATFCYTMWHFKLQKDLPAWQEIQKNPAMIVNGIFYLVLVFLTIAPLFSKAREYTSAPIKWLEKRIYRFLLPNK